MAAVQPECDLRRPSFSDCHFVTDADIQAAFTIALRGYISTHYAPGKKQGEQTPYYELAREYEFELVTSQI